MLFFAQQMIHELISGGEAVAGLGGFLLVVMSKLLLLTAAVINDIGDRLGGVSPNADGGGVVRQNQQAIVLALMGAITRLSRFSIALILFSMLPW